MTRYLDSTQATSLLGISRATLYAYVSRGLLHAQTTPGTRESRYLREEVEQLASQRGRGRKPKDVAQATLHWGLPVLQSAITLIEDGQLYYRGHNALELAQEHSLEAVAALLWQCDAASAFPATADAPPAALQALAPLLAHRPCPDRLLALYAAASEDESTAAWQQSPPRLAAGCGAQLRLLAACLLGTAPSAAPLHQQCAQAWGLDAQGADLLRKALVLCADHELNASGFTARCVASTGASLRSAVVAGLAALSGGRHGGTTARVEAWWDELGLSRSEQAADSVQRLRLRLARGESLTGFGHHLYPQGDARARPLLAPLLRLHPHWATLVEQMQELTGQAPSIDFALVALRRHLQLPMGSAFGLFALGRCVGWLAQALEQRASGQIIRPRAAYTGLRPSDLTAKAAAMR